VHARHLRERQGAARGGKGRQGFQSDHRILAAEIGDFRNVKSSLNRKLEIYAIQFAVLTIQLHPDLLQLYLGADSTL
jgi:hypothetical protein